MALKKCKECGNEVSTTAASCPKCGAVIKKKLGCLGCVGAAAIVVVVLGVIGSLMSDDAGSVQRRSARTDGNETGAGRNALDKKKQMTPRVEILQKSEKAEVLLGQTHRTIMVEVRNNTDQLIDYVQVNGTWYDASGKLVGTGMGNTTNLAAGATRTIDVIGMNVEGAAKYKVDVEDTVF